MWGGFPSRLAEATGLGALVYSRGGYGGSDPIALPRPLRFMHDEALQVLPEVLALTGVRNAVLVGHSDGGSIALIHAGSDQGSLVRVLILEAPHVFCEELSVRSIAAAAERYRQGDLRRALERHHGANVDVAFWGWNHAWLDPGFRDWNIEGVPAGGGRPRPRHSGGGRRVRHPWTGGRDRGRMHRTRWSAWSCPRAATPRTGSRRRPPSRP